MATGFRGPLDEAEPGVVARVGILHRFVTYICDADVLPVEALDFHL